MKIKLILLTLIAVMLIPVVSFAQDPTWSVTDSWTLTWDPVINLADGTDIKPADVITYNVVFKDADTGIIVNVPSCEGTLNTNCVITHTGEGSYLGGVMTVRDVAGLGVNILESEYSWTDDPLVTANGPFGVKHYIAPARAGGLR